MASPCPPTASSRSSGRVGGRGSTAVPHPVLPAALPDPPCSIAAAPVHICPCACSYLLQLKPALQHCKSSLQLIYYFPPTPLLLCFLAQSALKLCSFSSILLSLCPPRPPGVGQSPSSGWAGSLKLPRDPRPAWFSQTEAKSSKAHTISKQCRNYRSRVGS